MTTSAEEIGQSMKIQASFSRFTFLSLFVFVTVANPAAQMPSFEQYRVAENYKGKVAPPVLSEVQPAIRAKLKGAARQKPNFAGHYILLTWSCGSECLTGCVIDATTGHIYMLPVSLCCWNPDGVQTENPIEFHRDSKLIIFKGGRNGKACDWGQHYYQFDKGQFELIKTTSAQQCP
jgi:hypothetical protein